MLLDTLHTVVKPSFSESTPVPALCEAVAESSNSHLAWSILSPCGLTVEIGRDCHENVGAAWCVSEYCKQVYGTGIRVDGAPGVANFISQLGDVSTLNNVELTNMCEVDGEFGPSELFVLRVRVREFVLRVRVREVTTCCMDTI